MGWTSYHATHYTRRGEIDRKAECDEQMSGTNSGGEKWEILKSAMRGSVYYAAIRHTKTDGSSYVFGCVCLTSVDSSDYFNFSYKSMDEDMGPNENKCPLSILSLLSPTESEFALAWRQRCRENAENQNSLGRLPVGTLIEFDRYDGTTIRLEKRSPAYQFKTAWWKVVGANNYFKKNQIPASFRVVEAAASA